MLDPILVAAARAAGVEVRHGSNVVGLRHEGGRVVGVEAVGHRRVEQFSAPLVVGADGRRSTVARLVQAPATHRGLHTSSFVYGYFSGLAAAGYEWAYRPGAAAGFIPTNGGLTCVFAGGLPARIGRGGAATLRAVVAAASPELGERLAASTLVSPARTFPGQPGHLRRPWGPGWALVGDAGSWKDPITAHGLTDALRDAELLARAAVQADGCGDADPYAEYERSRDRLTLPMLRDGDEIAAMAWDDARIAVLLRSLNTAMNQELETILAFDRPRPLTPAAGVA